LEWVRTGWSTGWLPYTAFILFGQEKKKRFFALHRPCAFLADIKK
jgi:hypothetical protein